MSLVSVGHSCTDVLDHKAGISLKNMSLNIFIHLEKGESGGGKGEEKGGEWGGGGLVSRRVQDRSCNLTPPDPLPQSPETHWSSGM